VYADADLVLLDDPISALDAEVGKKVFKEVIRGMCKDKTTILATHAVDFFKLADRIVVLDKGMIVATGTLEQVKSNQIMKEIIAQHDETR